MLGKGGKETQSSMRIFWRSLNKAVAIFEEDKMDFLVPNGLEACKTQSRTALTGFTKSVKENSTYLNYSYSIETRITKGTI